MKESSLLSVVVPVYGTEQYLRRCLDSILKQSYKNLEVIVVDDCSPDHAAEIIQEYCAADARVKSVKHDVNKGLFQARVTGSQAANGKYIAFVDSDDYLSLDFYRPLLETAERENCDIVAGNTVRKQGDNYSQYTMHKICFGSEKLVGDQVRNTFFGQQSTCYAWHTVWNKVYSNTLWDKCLPEYKKINQHLIMTEDIAFSCVLFYHARSFMHVENSAAYYYCFNENASTNTEKITFKRLKKNMTDLNLVFNFVDTFLASVKADAEIIGNFKKFRKHYYLMWSHLQEDLFSFGDNAKEVKALLAELGKGVDDEKKEDYNFEFTESQWHEEVEKIRKQIADEDVKVVSFDIFDTLLLRPLWNPDDIFVLMQAEFEKVCPAYANVNFKTLRQSAENAARSRIAQEFPGYEDVTLTEIYEELSRRFGITKECADAMQQHEIDMEYQFAQVRNTGKELFDFARAYGKTVILTSDMYLEKEDVERMLQKIGIEGYDHFFLSSEEKVTKFTGNLFLKALSTVNVPARNVLHIGDNWEHDVGMSKKKGMQSAFLAKAKDRFGNTISFAPTNYLGTIGCLNGRQTTTWNKMNASIGYRSMKALAANRLFDNPYASWNKETDFDTNPYVMGYYAVGMHLVGVSKWLSGIVKKRGLSHVTFLARDGYLPKMVFDEMKSYWDLGTVATNYVPCSRMCLLPWMIDNAQGLYNLPIEYRGHNPKSIMQLLRCCYAPVEEKAMLEMLEKAHFMAAKNFTRYEEFIRFINWFRENFFDARQLEAAKALVTEFYTQHIPQNSLVFDLGYSGRILSALKKCLPYPVVFAYIHQDNSSFETYRRRDELDVELMYDFVPPFSDLIREYFLSEVGNSCVGLEKKDGKINALFTDTAVPFGERFISLKIKEGVLQFVQDFINSYTFVKDQMYFNDVLVSMPFEGLLHDSNYEDRNVLALAFSEDTVYGQNKRIGMNDFWKRQSPAHVVKGTAAPASPAAIQVESNELRYGVEGKSKFQKAIMYAICDRPLLKEKVKAKLKGHPFILKITKRAYKIVKKKK